MSTKRKLSLLLFLVSFSLMAQKPAVWLISDGGKNINDPDDISALASYILMSNQFDTRAIVLASTTHPWNKDTENQQKWAEDTYGKAYKADLPNLNKYIGGYQKEFRFLESAIKGQGKSFSPVEDYSLQDYPSIQALFKEVDKSKKIINVLCYGPLTEQAIFVSYCIKNKRTDLLNKVRFISHWTSSNFHVGTKQNPEHTHNCFADGVACHYMKQRALGGTIKFYECGGIGQHGIVEPAQKGKRYYSFFKESNLGKIFAEGKFNKNRVDDSDSATYWALLGNYGVSLNDIASNGTNFPEVEERNEKAFAVRAKDIRNELLRRSNAAAGYNPDAISVDVIVPEHGMADPHAWVQNDTVFAICGHDESWTGKGSFRMDRWEVWSSTDLKTWNHHSNILPKDTYIGDHPNCWAGDITERDGKYYWYFSNRYKDTGVVVADKITGPYKDVLGKPLLPKDIVPEHPYDPEIYIEDGVYTICFGAGTYYMATLAKDMMSLETKPKPITIYKDGKKFTSEDKSTLFKRNGWYYLVFGSRYAMSKNLYGPYEFKGAFLSGGHTSFFDWHGQKYVLHENHDISAFYRGASLKPVFFNEDETIRVPKSDRMYPAPGRPFQFINSTMGWRAVKGTDLVFKNGIISGNITEKKALITSAPWLYTESKLCSKISFEIKNNTSATSLKIAIYSRDKGSDFWSMTDPVDWTQQEWVTIPISANDKEFKTYHLNLSKFTNIKERIMQIGIQPAENTNSGLWQIEEVIIE
ncbi:family 43 glycosylhydrolase [Wenyingzhuangia sp. IMCC45574]